MNDCKSIKSPREGSSSLGPSVSLPLPPFTCPSTARRPRSPQRHFLHETAWSRLLGHHPPSGLCFSHSPPQVHRPPAPRHSSLVPSGWPSHESPALLTKLQPLPTTASQTRARQLAQTSPRQRAPARPLLLIPQHVTAVFCDPSSVRSLPHTQRPESCPAHKNRSANIC